MTFTSRAYTYIKEKELISKGEKICVGISGGADSVCLLQLLFELEDKMQISLCAFHVNHNLRGSESDADEEFVKSFCAGKHIPLEIFSYDVEEISRKNKTGHEETGRILRRRAAFEAADKFGADKIALAHHMNDSAETLLFNLARGTSLAGLKGIAPKNGNIIRPLLIFKKNEIEDELLKRKINWRTDSSNLAAEYSRNKLRLNTLPYLEENINKESIRHMAAAAKDIEEAEKIIKDIADEKTRKLVSLGSNEALINIELKKEGRLIGGYIVLNALKSLTEKRTDIKRRHIDAVRKLAEGTVSSSVDLPYGIKAVRVYEGIRLIKNQGEIENEENTDFCPFNINGITSFGGYIFKSRIIECIKLPDEIPTRQSIKWFDYDKLSAGLVLRYRQSGDYLITDANGHRKKLKKYLIDEKIPKEERANLICLAQGQQISWIVGRRMGEDCKIDKNTRRILEICCEPEANTCKGNLTDG